MSKKCSCLKKKECPKKECPKKKCRCICEPELYTPYPITLNCCGPTLLGAPGNVEKAPCVCSCKH